MKFPKIETERLLLRHYQADDLEGVYQLFSDRDVTRFFPPEFTVAREDVLASLPRRTKRWEKQGFGQFGVFDKADQNLIGYCGLQYLDNSEMVEIFYGFFRKFWGQGLATEAARATLRFGFEEIKLKKIVAVTHPENFVSQMVLKKIGFGHGEKAKFYNFEVVYFEFPGERFKIGQSFYQLSYTES